MCYNNSIILFKEEKTVKVPNRSNPIYGWDRISQKEVDKMRGLSPSFAEPVDEIWAWKRPLDMFLVEVHNIGARKFGTMTHLTVKKVDVVDAFWNLPNAFIHSQEPNYSEKVAIVQKLTANPDTVAMEVFPIHSNIVDNANLYHIWIAEKSKFPFSTTEISTLPENKEWESERVGDLDVEYMVRIQKRENFKCVYLYVRRKDGKELRWWEKQHLKDELQYEGLNAVEVISKYGVDNPTCLLCFPLDYTFDFGLRN